MACHRWSICSFVGSTARFRSRKMGLQTAVEWSRVEGGISGRRSSTNLISSDEVQWCHRASELDCGQAEGDCWASLKFGGGVQSKSFLEIVDVGDVKTRPRRSSNPLLSRDTGSDAGGCGVVAGSGVDPVSVLCADRWRKGSQ